jgi:hypothetical protein
MWEQNHLLLFQASLEWLKDGRVNKSQGTSHKSQVTKTKPKAESTVTGHKDAL